MAITAYPILRFFRTKHLPERIAVHSRPFEELALKMIDEAPDDVELVVALRKLREAKDSYVGLMAIT